MTKAHPPSADSLLARAMSRPTDRPTTEVVARGTSEGEHTHTHSHVLVYHRVCVTHEGGREGGAAALLGWLLTCKEGGCQGIDARVHDEESVPNVEATLFHQHRHLHRLTAAREVEGGKGRL